jgi:hypothetical protein
VRAEEWRQEAQQYKDETNKLLEDMATDILTFSDDELELQSKRSERDRGCLTSPGPSKGRTSHHSLKAGTVANTPSG